MPSEWKPVPLINQPNESADDVENESEMSTLVDGVTRIVGQKLHIERRFGLQDFVEVDTGLPVDGLHWWDEQECALLVSAGRVWKIVDSRGTMSEITGSTDLLQGSIVSFDNTADRAFMANGGKIVHTDLNTLTTMADGDAPQRCSHVAILDGYLWGNELDTENAKFSSVTDLLDWNALDFIKAEAKPDNIVALGEGFQELILLGRKSVEFWFNDGQTPFSRIPGSVQPFGISAIRSLAQVGNSWMWLAHNRKFVTMEGRAVTPVSSPYDRLIQGFASVDDAVGYGISVAGYPLYVLNFPTARQTLVFNYETKIWQKWGHWNSQTATYQRYRGQTYCYAKAWNLHLIGDYETGKVYTADRAYQTDAGTPIRTLIRSGHLDHGAPVTKRSNIFRLKVKRGAATDECPNPQIMLRRRVDNKAQWGNERWKSLGKVGQHEPFIDWRANGIYKTCQYEIVCSDPVEFVVMGAIENLDWLLH